MHLHIQEFGAISALQVVCVRTIKHPRKYKMEALELLKRGDKSAGQIGWELGITPSLLEILVDIFEHIYTMEVYIVIKSGKK